MGGTAQAVPPSIWKRDGMMIPKELMHDGARKRVEKWEAQWSLALKAVPHLLWIKFEGESKYTRFTSDTAGDFPDLDLV
jgi:hypothetical protein